MPFVLGIDEAGYGPMLGPLVVGATLWQMDGTPDGCDFWSRLSAAVSRDVPRRANLRVPVADSKALYDRKAGINTLERTVLAFASAAGHEWRSLDHLLAGVEFDRPSAAGLPWYRESSVTLPIDGIHSAHEGVAARLRETMTKAGTILREFNAWVVSEARFNQRVATTQNKAAVVIEAVLGLIAWAASRIANNDLFVYVDRLGGRTNYRNLLAQSFPERHVHVVNVSDEDSRYRLATESSDWFIDFCVEGERHHLPIALASMFAKYVRELLMLRFNEFWTGLVPTLRPTAGYHTDAERFLADIAPALPHAGLPTEAFIRAR